MRTESNILYLIYLSTLNLIHRYQTEKGRIVIEISGTIKYLIKVKKMHTFMLMIYET